MVSVLITHYNRYSALERCLQEFKKLDIENIEIVVADDGSSKEIQKKIKENLKIDVLICSTTNKGLSSNLNLGIKACNGEFILYCQEDFIPTNQLKTHLDEAICLMVNSKVDMCRLKANYQFPHLKPLSSKFRLIPKFSTKNLFYNYYQYSDHPFLVKSEFFKKFGLYLENVNGPYGENEYAIRIMKSNAKIAISCHHPFQSNSNVESIIKQQTGNKPRKLLKFLNFHKTLRMIRFYLEYMFYNPQKRKLYTFQKKR